MLAGNARGIGGGGAGCKRGGGMGGSQGGTDTIRGSARRAGQAFSLVALCALSLMIAGKANAMGKMCLFSAVRGVVLDHGQPVEGATIERTYKWAWKDQSGGDRTVTDATGGFALPTIWGHSLLGSILPHEPVVDETILIHHGGQTYKAWMYTRGNYVENSELDGRPIVLTCRLEADVTHHGPIYGICEPQ